jgi:membrane protein
VSDPGEPERFTPIPLAEAGGWWSLARRVWRRFADDNARLLAAGVAFYGVFAVFPTIVALVSVYGLVADPADIARQVQDATAALPDPTQEFLVTQVDAVVATSGAELGLALVLAVVIALWSASSGVRHLMESVRVAYREPRQRFVRLRAQALLLAVAGVLLLAALVVALTVVPAVVGRIAPNAGTLSAYVRWPVIAVLIAAATGVVYRVAPTRDTPRRHWWSLGGAIATGMWLLSSIGLAVYAEVFPNLDAAYGSFVAVLVTMLWLWLSALSVLVGAYVNDETERPTRLLEPPAAGPG